MKSLFILPILLINVAKAQVSVFDCFKSYNSTIKKKSDTTQDSIFFYKNKDYRIVTHLHGIGFKKNAYFDGIDFHVHANFSTATFKGDAEFQDAKFEDVVDFSSVTFNKDINFTSCNFVKFLFMSGIRTDTATVFYFYKATLPDIIDFSHNKILHQIVDFTDADFVAPAREKTFWSDSRVFINIYDSDINKLKLDYLHFRLCFYDPRQTEGILGDSLQKIRDRNTTKQLLKNGDTLSIVNETAIYNTLIKYGDYRKYLKQIFPSTSLDDPLITNFSYFYIGQGRLPARLSYDQTEALYSRLLKNFELNGQKMSYELLDVERNNFIHYYINIPHLWNRYGYNNEWIFYWTAFFLILFTLINYKCYTRFFEQTNEIDNLEKIPVVAGDTKYPKLIKLKYAFMYTSLIFFSFSLKTEKMNYKRSSFFYVLIINIVGLLCLGYLANFILQK